MRPTWASSSSSSATILSCSRGASTHIPTSSPTTLLPTTMAETIHHIPRKLKQSTKTQLISVTKRTLSLSVLLGFPVSLLLPSSSSSSSSSAAAEEQQTQLPLKRYTDTQEGFTFLVPSSWIKVEKAGATVLFEEENKGSNNVGVVVSPVRLNSLGEFGNAQFVADKLIQAEKRKESTKEAEVVGVSERMGRGGLQVYEFEYTIDSTRGGMKRIFSAAFVASKKLYILNIAYSDKPENPFSSDKRTMLEQVLHSFDTTESI